MQLRAWRQRCCATTYQVPQTLRQILIIDDIKQSAPSVLAAGTGLSCDGSLLIHIRKNRVVLASRGRDPYLCVVEVRT